MPKPSLPFLHPHVSRHGTVTYYVKLSKRQGGRGVRIEDRVYRSEAFMAEYNAIVRGLNVAVPVHSKDGKGTLGWLIRLFRQSRAWTHDISQGTRKQRGPILQKLEKDAGHLPPAAITRASVEKGMNKRTKNQARHFANTMSRLFEWAIENDLFAGRNPAHGIKRPRSDSKDVDDGHLPWPIELIEQFERRWPLGTKQRLAFDVFLYVGLRRGDAARLGRQHMPRGIVRLKTEKTGMKIGVPVHPALATSIKACPSPGLAIIAKADGTNYTKEALGNWFREAIEAAGIPVTKRGLSVKGYSAHGLRKASATIAAESGYTEAELNAMFGWSGSQMAQLYTKTADREKLASRAMAKWTRPSAEEMAAVPEVAYLQLEDDQDVG